MIERGRRLPFVVLPWAVLEDETLTATDVLVYATIARFADNRTGEAYPSRTTIAKLARFSDPKTIDRSIGRLVKAGFLTKTIRRTAEGDPDSNLYIVHEIAEQGVVASMPPGSGTGATGGSGTHATRTRTNLTRKPPDVETDSADLSEWTLPPDDVKARMASLGLGGTE